MGALIHPFIEICLLRMKPQDLPTSGTLLALVLVAHALVSMAGAALSLRPGQALVAGCIDTALMCGLTTGLLALRTVRERTVQTLTALAGAGAVIGFVAYPVSLWLHNAQQTDGPSPALWALLFAVLGWSLAVSAHVLRHALSAPYFVGLLISAAFYLISVRVLTGLFPVAA